MNISPSVGSKFSRLDRAGDELRFGRDVPFKFELGNPSLEASLLTIEAVTNVPVHAWHQNAENIQNGLNSDYEIWQRAHMFGGWTPWNVGVDPDKEEKEERKEKRKAISKQKAKVKREEKKKADLKEKEVKGIEKQKKEKKEGKQVTCLVCKLPIERGKKYCTIHEKTKQRDDGKKIQCRKRKSDGKRCGMQTSNKSGYCYYHD